MGNVLIMLYEGLIIALIFGIFAYAQRAKLDKWQVLLLGLFCAYVGLLYSVTGVPSLYDISVFYQSHWLAYVNLFPFSQTVNVIDYVLNIVLFIPLGILLPLGWSQYRSLRSVLLAGILCSGWIEVVQLLNHRITDIDDLLMNVLGAVLGYGLYRLLPKRVQRVFKPLVLSPWVYLLGLYLGRFILFHERALASYLYHF